MLTHIARTASGLTALVVAMSLPFPGRVHSQQDNASRVDALFKEYDRRVLNNRGPYLLRFGVAILSNFYSINPQDIGG